MSGPEQRCNAGKPSQVDRSNGILSRLPIEMLAGNDWNF
jgi:hypothetical protein